MTEQNLSASHLWGESFLPNDSDIEFIYNLLLEEGVPLDIHRLAAAVVRERLQREAMRRAKLSSHDAIYYPKNTFRPGDSLVFPASGFLHGTVLDVRRGRHPEAGEFDVIRVQTDSGEKEFAAGLADHKLNDTPLDTMSGAGDISAESIVSEAGPVIEKSLESRLTKHSDIVCVAGQWFPRALLAEISPGHFNLAEAVLDVASGGPLPTASLMEHVELAKNIDPRLASFSMDYALYQDERFDEVGPAGEMLWFLRRLEPPEVAFPPRRLLYTPNAGAAVALPPTLSVLERELEDEWGEGQVDPRPDEEGPASLVLTFPHWRVGTLPLNARMARIFPHAHEAAHIRFEFIDAEDGKRTPGWVVSNHRYVYGLLDWYQQKGLLPGGQVSVRRGDIPGEVILSTSTRRPVREWVRTAAVNPNGRVSFTMQKQAIAVEYDELMVIAVSDPQAVDDLWLRIHDQKVPLGRQVADVFRELAKLNPQSTVHARTLYSAVNVIGRVPPGPVFRELAERPYYSHVGDLYYRFDEAQWTENR